MSVITFDSVLKEYHGKSMIVKLRFLEKDPTSLYSFTFRPGEQEKFIGVLYVFLEKKVLHLLANPSQAPSIPGYHKEYDLKIMNDGGLLKCETRNHITGLKGHLTITDMDIVTSNIPLSSFSSSADRL